MSSDGASAGIRVALDATPVLGRRTGIGVYTAHLLAALAADPGLRVTAAPVTLRGRRPADLPPGVAWHHRPLPARLVRRCWAAGLPVPSQRLLSGAADVVHGTNFVLGPTGRARGAVTVHDLTYLHHPGWVDAASQQLLTLVPAALRRAAVVFTPSAAVAAELADAYPGVAGRTRVTPLGVDERWATAVPATVGALAALGLPPEYLLAVGTREPRKGLDTLVAAHRLARRRDAQLPPLVLVGAAGWGADVAGDGRDVHLAGYLPDDALPGVVAAAAGFVFPSRYEGFGIPPLEALAAGVPVLASDLPVTREVLGEHARFVPSGDVEALAAALPQLLAAPPDPGPGRAHAARFRWADTAAATAAGYREVR